MQQPRTALNINYLVAHPVNQTHFITLNLQNANTTNIFTLGLYISAPRSLSLSSQAQ